MAKQFFRYLPAAPKTKGPSVSFKDFALVAFSLQDPYALKSVTIKSYGDRFVAALDYEFQGYSEDEQPDRQYLNVEFSHSMRLLNQVKRVIEEISKGKLEIQFSIDLRNVHKMSFPTGKYLHKTKPAFAIGPPRKKKVMIPPPTAAIRPVAPNDDDIPFS